MRETGLLLSLSLFALGGRDSSRRINPGGFSCRWLGHVGKDQPGPDSDVQRGHAICVVGVSAAAALEFLLRGAVLLSNVRTVFAGAGAGGVARAPPSPPSPFSFFAQGTFPL